MTFSLKFLRLIFAVAFSLALAGCGTSSDSNDADATGTLEIHVTDHREAIGDFARLDVEIDTVRLHPKRLLSLRKSDWLDLQPSVANVDLTQVTEKRTIAVWRGELPAGRFEAVHLKLQGAGGELKAPAETVPVADEAGPIRLPFDIRENALTRIVVDLVRGYELYYNDALADKVPPG